MTDLDTVLNRLNEVASKVDRRPYYTLTDLKQILRVDKAKLREWIESGELEAINVGTRDAPRWRISPAALEAWRISRRVVPQSTPRRRRPKVTKRYFR